MKKMLQITLGIVTSVGGFLEIGSVTTAAQAGASFGYQLLWAILLGTICLIFLVEMSGRLAAVSKHTIVEATRERFGFPFFFIVLIGMVIVASLVLVAELGGIGLSIQILTGIGFPWWAIPVSFIVWILMWKGTFGLIENGASLLGLVTVSFVVAAVKLHPSWSSAAHGLLPSFPGDHSAKYWFVAVSILGASISPYLMYFYS
ncbi:MAG: Nramp family divalent metal transporter, partial [Gemmatimonadota bacterium]|nr:Nramp family divalent metal transporter [Gemmatimonadota bacterium]